MLKKLLLISAIALALVKTEAADSALIGIVNFTKCIVESKYGKNEQAQLENIKNQWSTLIEQTDKELRDVAEKLENQDYLDGLSPEAEKELQLKYRALNEDMAKYQNQLYQVLNQANYIFIQKMSSYIAKASEKIAKDKKLQMVLNQEACFYAKPELDVTKSVISQMDRDFSKDEKTKKLSENKEISPEDAQKISENKEEVKDSSDKVTK